MISRERFFECVFSQETGEFRFHVRARNARDAEAEARLSLQDRGVRAPGTLRIRDPKGVELVRAAYAADPC